MSYDFVEPAPAPDYEVALKSTGQSLADVPNDTALIMIEDPERAKRQLSQPVSGRAHRKPHRAQDSKAADADGGQADGRERLFLRLRRQLVPSPTNTKVSDMRETPDRGEEDYRHDRKVANEAATGRKHARRAASATFDSFIEPDDGKTNATKPPAKRVKTEAVTKAEDTTEKADRSAEAEQHSGTEKNKVGIVNNDFCNACGGTGDLLCCETCVRSFHFSCIDPPVMDVKEIEEEEWSCRACKPLVPTEDDRKKFEETFFEPLIMASMGQNASAFQLPVNLREMFAHVDFTRYGEFLDEASKTPHAPPVHRIQNREGEVLLCFKCRGNGLNDRSLAVCSKCEQPWHIDCLDPPLESTPYGFWVCPLHAGRQSDLIPRRVRNPQVMRVKLPRNVPNNGDIEIEEEEDEEEREKNHEPAAAKAAADKGASGRTLTTDFDQEDTVSKVYFGPQSRVAKDGTVVGKIPRQHPKGFEQDRIVHKISARTIKLDFLDAVLKTRSAPFRESSASDFMLGLNLLADKPQSECEAVRNLMLLNVSGPTVSTARAKENLNTLVEAALDDDNELGQIAAIRKLMKEKGKERLLELLQST